MTAKDEMMLDERSPDEILGEIADLIKSESSGADLQEKYNDLAYELNELGVTPPDLKGLKNEGREQRTFQAKELRISRDNGDAKIVGYAAVFDQLSEELWGFREKIAPGAFAKTIKEADVRALFNHDANYVLGRTKSGTLELEEDEIGLAIEVDPPDTQWARDLTVSIERGDVSQMSFGFETIRDSWLTVDDESIRTLEEVSLFDVSPVTFPAYPQTTVQLRDLGDIEYAHLLDSLAHLESGTANETHRVLLSRFIEFVQGSLDATPTPESHLAEISDADRVKASHAARKRRLELMQLNRN